MLKKVHVSLALFFVTIIVLFILYFNVFRSLIGQFTYNAYSYDTYNIDLKLNRARSIEENKIIINSGSNSNFGINSRVLEELSSWRVVNLANHASNNIKYLNYLTLKYLKPGDIVVYPLEYQYYGRRDTYNDYQVKTYLNNGKDYYRSLDWLDRLNFVRHISPNFFLLETLRGEVRTPKDVTTLSSEVTGTFLNYQHKSLSLYLDMDVGIGTEQSVYESAIKDRIYIPAISDDFKRALTHLHDQISASGSKLYVTFPAAIDTVAPNTSAQEMLKNEILSLGVNFICEPGQFNYPVDLFFNTYYHLNNKGARIRTKDLYDCMEDSSIFETNKPDVEEKSL